jgi:hypothetical protein
MAGQFLYLLTSTKIYSNLSTMALHRKWHGKLSKGQVMRNKKNTRSIYLDEEIQIIQNAALKSGIDVYETDTYTRKKGQGVGHCGKATFRDLREVKRALFVIRTKRAAIEAEGEISKRQEKRYYFCNRCHAFHITSKADRFEVAVNYVQAA